MTENRSATVLALNGGSSSLKFGLYRVGTEAPEVVFSGEADLGGGSTNPFRVDGPSGAPWVRETAAFTDQHQAIVRIGDFLAGSHLPAPTALGHRVVHGGPQLRQHCLIDDAVLQQLEAATAFAPLHIPPALSIIRFSQERFRGIPQAACFDTAFHADLPDIARTLPIARELRQEGIQRYGFHANWLSGAAT